jgi:signal transduction histidine kinase
MSIAKKVTLVVCLLAIGLLMATGYAGLLLREQESQEQVRAHARMMAGVLRFSAEAVLESYGHLKRLERSIGRSKEWSVTIFDRDGRAVVPQEEAPVVNARALRVMERDQPEDEVAAGAYAYRLPLHHRGRVAGGLELRIDLASLVPRDLPKLAALIAGAVLLLFALLVGVFSRTAIGRPIDQLMGGMDHVIKGDLTVALPLDRNDEIGRIAYRFNEMTAQLRDAQEEIRRSADAKLTLEQRLRSSEKLATIGQLSAEIAHEVGTPLNVIGGRARALERKAEQPAEVRKNSQIIADQAERITKIIQQMLDLSRGRIPEKTEVDLARTLGDALAFLEYQTERAGIEVARRIDAALPRVKGDGDGLQQVFINLILNAVQAMRGGGTLEVGARAEHRRKEGLDLAPPQEFVVVEIRDSGPGIPEAEHAQIFEPFYSTKPRGEGTGLGLTVVHGIVKDHDGWIEVENARPHGTLFRVYLPVEEHPATVPHADDTREIKRAGEEVEAARDK